MRRRARRRRPYRQAQRDHAEFAAAIAASLGRLARHYGGIAERYAGCGYVPSHTFRMDLTQRVDEDRLREDLEAVGIRTVSSALAGHWIVEGVGDYTQRLSAKAEERAGRSRSTFVDAIAGIAAVPPEEKIDRRLSGIPAGEEAYLDVEAWPMAGGRLGDLVGALGRIAAVGGGRGKEDKVLDTFSGSSHCAIRMRCAAALFLEVASLPEVERVGPPPRIQAMNTGAGRR